MVQATTRSATEVYDIVRFKPVCSATKTSQNNKIWPLACPTTIQQQRNAPEQTVRMRRLVCTLQLIKSGFLEQRYP